MTDDQVTKWAHNAAFERICLSRYASLLAHESVRIQAKALCLLRIDDQMTISVLGVSEEAVVVDLHLSLLVAVLEAELHVLRKALAFLLGQRGHDRQQHLTFSVHLIDGFLLEENGDVHILEFSDILQAVQRVTGKPADRLGDDHVDISGVAFLDHAVKLIAP